MTSFLLLPLFLLGLIFGIVAAARRVRPVRSGHHHWVVRVLGAVLLLAAVTAVGIGTWRGSTQDLAIPPLLVKEPAKPVPPIQSTADSQHVDLGPCKLVGTVMLARMERDRFYPVCGESLVLEWPPAAASDLVFHGEHGGFSYTVTLDLREFVSWGGPGVIQTRHGISVAMKGAGFSGTSGGTTLKLDTLTVMNAGHFSASLGHAPLSIMPAPARPDYRLLIHLTRAASDDPLAEIPVAKWLADQAGKTWQSESPWMHSYPGVRDDPKMPPGVRMLAFLGPAAFLLGLAAIAGAVVFRRGWRVPACAGLLALMVLYAGWLDALVLRRRADLTIDSNQPESVRLLALAGMVRGTFFHRGEAVDRVRSMAADPAIPAALRDVARAAWSGDFKSP